MPRVVFLPTLSSLLIMPDGDDNRTDIRGALKCVGGALKSDSKLA